MCGGISHFTLYSANLKRKSLQDPKTHWVLKNNLHNESGDGHSEKAGYTLKATMSLIPAMSLVPEIRHPAMGNGK